MNHLTFVIYFVELCAKIFPNVSNNVQTRWSQILIASCRFFFFFTACLYAMWLVASGGQGFIFPSQLVYLLEGASSSGGVHVPVCAVLTKNHHWQSGSASSVPNTFNLPELLHNKSPLLFIGFYHEAALNVFSPAATKHDPWNSWHPIRGVRERGLWSLDALYSFQY